MFALTLTVGAHTLTVDVNTEVDRGKVLTILSSPGSKRSEFCTFPLEISGSRDYKSTSLSFVSSYRVLIIVSLLQTKCQK